jgi:GT2 family glycosyltransferase
MQVDWVTGAAMMIRKEVLSEVGLLDDGYFLYFDEVDFCFRARQAGWPAYYVPDSVVTHLQAQATGITDDRKDKRRYPDYWFDSRRRFFVKNRGKAQRCSRTSRFYSATRPSAFGVSSSGRRTRNRLISGGTSSVTVPA